MAQLKDLIVNGASRVLGDLFANKIQTNKLNVPTSSGGTSYGAGTSGQVLKTNGTTVYWGADNNTTYSSKTATSGGTDVSLVTTGEKYTWNNKTSNTGTVTSVAVSMNDTVKGTVTSSGTINLGTVLTAHQDISGKEDSSNKVVSWSTTTTDTHYPSEKLVKTALDGKADSSHTHSYAGSSSAGGAATSANKVNKSLTVGSKTFDGSSAVSITASDLGLSKAMQFIGKATVAITDGSTTDPTITGYSTKTAGDVIIDKDGIYEYVWTGSAWELLGGDSSYSIVGHTHNYAGSSSAGGAATSANKLNTDAGSATQPIYFSNGIPVSTDYALNKTVPSNAVFTDTTYSAGTGIGLSGTTFSNTGVRSIATGSTNGTISVNTNGTSADVTIKGLGTAAYTASSAYATAAQGTTADNAIPSTETGLNTAINKLSTGSSTPTDNDYYISQYAGGGTTTTTYHRRPMSALWAYIKAKGEAVWAGLTKTGTVTSVAVSMNDTVKGTITSSGTINLGTVATTDTKNTTGSTNTANTMYLIGAQSQSANPQTYSNDNCTLANGTMTLTGTNNGIVLKNNNTNTGFKWTQDSSGNLSLIKL